ncbi:rab11 family-interacting protein 4A isoform X2 [Scyliorhinus torazame]|uniref:rab11 family-interacting protein 4A isoform X2 n=1 Tax=Scyliorhinus torazame TaxID=75743 RepID=UPI003B59F669
MDVDGEEQCQEESLAQFVRKLREVFDAVAGDTGGFLRVENFIHLGLQFMEGEEMQKVTKYLDPRNMGRISFQEFCHGIFAIKGCADLLDNALCMENPPMAHYAPEFEDYYCRQSAQVTDSGFLDCESAESEGEIYTDDDAMTLAQQAIPQESDMDSAIENAQSSEAPEPGREDGKGSQMVSLFLPRTEQAGSPSFSEQSSSSLLSAEEQYEDYGEADESDFIPSSPCPDYESRTNGCSDLGSSVSSSAVQTPRKMRHVFSSEFLDVYCSQCSKKMNLLNDLEARLKKLKANSPNRKISSTAFGRQLFHNSNISSSNGSTEDLFRDSIDSCDNDITEKVSYLEKKVTELENECLLNCDQKNKLKHENTQLVHRVHAMEEQLKDQETRAEEVFQEEFRRHREILNKLEREKNVEIEMLTARAQQLEEESNGLKNTATRLKCQTEKLDEEHQRITYKLEDTSLRLKDEMDLYKKMMDKMRWNRHEFQKERELIEDLRKELEYLQIFQLDSERAVWSRNPASNAIEISFRSKEMELEYEAKRLKQENLRLKEQNDDLNGQILSLSLYEAKNLFATQTKAQSLAAEIDTATRDQLMEALQEQEEINLRLRQYMDKIILAILDHNPSILEIKK